MPAEVRHHVLYDLLKPVSGPFDPNQLRFSLIGFSGNETENHTLNIETSRFLANQLLFKETGDPAYNNATNGTNAFLADYLHQLLTRDFLEYNARPYQDYAIPAVQNLYSFAADLNDAPPGSPSSHAIKLAARMVLDYVTAKAAVSSDDARRASPYRRRADHDVGKPWHDMLGADGDPQMPRMMQLAGVGIDQLGYIDPTLNMGPGVAITNYSLQMVHAAFSSYRAPDLILDEALNREGLRNYEAFHHTGDEIYWRSTSYMLSAGGRYAPILYQHQMDPGTIGTVAGVAAAAAGVPVGALTATVLAAYKTSDDDSRGMVLPTTLIPARVVRNREDLLRFEGGYAINTADNSANLCVAPNFACGRSLRIPASYHVPTQGQTYAVDCYKTAPGADANSWWMFIDMSGSCGGDGRSNYFVAIWRHGGASDSDGFFEVFDKTAPPQDHPRRTRLQADPSLSGAPSAPFSAPATAETLTFEAFIDGVVARNGHTAFVVDGPNQGPQSYVMTDGTAVPFQIGPESRILTPPSTALVTGDFMTSDAPGRITINNSRLGETLILDDSNPAAPERREMGSAGQHPRSGHTLAP
jgi:hypothetical protein